MNQHIPLKYKNHKFKLYYVIYTIQLTFEGQCMWIWNEQRNQYYLRQFHEEQPDLNFWNPLVCEEIKVINYKKNI